MIMKKILFVIPSSQIGGVTTSLQSIIDNLNNDDYDIRIFAITHHQGCEITYRNILLPEDKLLSSYWCIYKREPYGRRIQFLGMKILKQLALRFGWPLEDWLFVRAMKRLESNFDFDTIIAFSEGATTKFVSYTTYPKKIGYIAIIMYLFLIIALTRVQYIINSTVSSVLVSTLMVVSFLAIPH